MEKELVTTMNKTKAGECAIVTAERTLTAVIKAKVRMDAIPEAQRSLRAKIDSALPSLDVGPRGNSVTLWHPPAGGMLYMEPGVIVARPFESAHEVVCSALPAGRAANFLLVGPYDGIPRAWRTLFDWCAAEGLTLAGINWEIYGESNGDPSTTETLLFALLA